MAVTSSSGRGRCTRVDVCAQGVGEEDAWSRVECCMRGGGGRESRVEKVDENRFPLLIKATR